MFLKSMTPTQFISQAFHIISEYAVVWDPIPEPWYAVERRVGKAGEPGRYFHRTPDPGLISLLLVLVFPIDVAVSVLVVAALVVAVVPVLVLSTNMLNSALIPVALFVSVVSFQSSSSFCCHNGCPSACSFEKVYC